MAYTEWGWGVQPDEWESEEGHFVDGTWVLNEKEEERTYDWDDECVPL